MREIIERCSVSEARLDLSFLFTSATMGKILLAMIEFKLSLDETQFQSAVKKTVCYMLCALAFSRWGMLRMTDPLVSLIVCRQSLYRLTLSRPDDKPFGLRLKVEKTTDVKMMEWVLHQYVQRYSDDFLNLASMALVRPLQVNPLDWTPINDWGGAQFVPIARPNLGFLFRTSSDDILSLAQKYRISLQALPRAMSIVVKYLSSLLYISYSLCAQRISTLLDKEADWREKDAAQREKELKYAALRKVQELEARIAIYEGRPGAVGSQPGTAPNEKINANAGSDGVQNFQRLSGGGEETANDPLQVEENFKGQNFVEVAPVTSPEWPEANPISEGGGRSDTLVDETSLVLRADGSTDCCALGVKHPYLGVLYLDQSKRHPLIVMRDVGESLLDLLMREGSTMRDQWRQSAVLRAAFFAQVGLSALNLVLQTGCCHNDLRPPNIAVQDGSFCIVDFDLSSATGCYNMDNGAFTPHLEANWNRKLTEQHMCFSVAQLALCAFMLSTPVTLGAVAKARSIWLKERDPTSAVDSEFELWARSCGQPFLSFVDAVRRACSAEPDRNVALFPSRDLTRYLVCVLRCMLRLPCESGPCFGCLDTASLANQDDAPPVGAAAGGAGGPRCTGDSAGSKDGCVRGERRPASGDGPPRMG